ncbi:MAG: flagellar biosynthesis protein FlhA [Syntrophomonadaceae bacterium]|nr:flagellar biosynthesis protein FlhA [Syntrophomonadaceae bacterium]
MAQVNRNVISSLKSTFGGRFSDFALATIIIGIVLIIVIPLPPELLSILLIFSLAFSMIILLATLFTTHPLQLSVFPALLLVVTLYRLALNISSTRLILSEGDAGSVIQAFGDFVVGGNYVVGFIVFIIITLVQFVVITSGAGRVAEVAARFTLDAMPGKQMSIDADLNSGLITEQEAKERRRLIQREADFFGAMDGASKFVKGDAIAGIVITLVNILGGIVIGMWQMGLSLQDALLKFTLLTVGDGLITQIPALLVSAAAGILVTRTGSNDSFGQEIVSQFSAYPKVIAMAAGILAFLALVPGLPPVPFLILAAGTGYIAYNLSQEAKRKEAEALQKAAMPEARLRQPENVLQLLQVDPLEIEIGYNLIPFTDESQGGDLLDRLAAVRRQCAVELGIYVRPIRIRDNLQLPPHAYAFRIRGAEVASGEVFPGLFLAMNPGGIEEPVAGSQTREPTFGLPAWWVNQAEKERLEMKGFTVVDSITVLITHLTEFIKSHSAELLGRQEVKELLDSVKESNPAVVEELVPDLLSLGEVQRVLQNLLREKVPIRNLVTVLETMADTARMTKDLDFITEAVRQSLSRIISRMYAQHGNFLAVITLHPKLEQALAEALQPTQSGTYPVLQPDLAQVIFKNLGEQAEKMALAGRQPVVLASARVRLPFKRLTERFLPSLTVLSLNELEPGLEIESIGTVTMD